MKKFSEFIKINENVSSMVFKTTASFEDTLIMNKPVVLFDMTESITIDPPPLNDSHETRAELSELADNMEHVTTIHECIDVLDPFVRFCASVGVGVNLSKMSQMIQESHTILHKLQYTFNRPRPSQLARSLNVGFPVSLIEHTVTPSYPSKLASQAYTISSYLSHLFPAHEQDFLNIAEEIGLSHVLKGISFPSDHESGRHVGQQLFQRLKDKT
jgi:hypothetical protein